MFPRCPVRTDILLADEAHCCLVRDRTPAMVEWEVRVFRSEFVLSLAEKLLTYGGIKEII